MNPLLVALLLVLLLPLFAASWRTSLLGLASQGLLMAWVAVRLQPELATAAQWVTLADLVLLRGVAGPWLLYRVLLARGAPPRHDVIPPNLLSWTAALAVVLVAFRFANVLVPETSEAQALVAVAVAGVMLGFLVLATQPGPFGQMVGALRIENAIALFELGTPHAHSGVGIQIGQAVVVLLTLVLYRWYLRALGPTAEPLPAAEAEGPEL
jgi:hydrogenase-4 component E